MNLLLAIAAAVAGAATSLQSAANAGLSSRIGLAPSLMVNTAIVLFCTFIFFFITRSTATFFPADTPWFLYIGGFCGFTIILVAAFVFPRIGAGPAVALMALGQAVAALAIDHFGVMGLSRAPVSLSRIGGFMLILAGVALIRR
ncbi:MAG TPA: DMT family transporter [Pyrinomonadaceae bacterium]|nr:DMT family transporter [Pyrinomonadaceae bacterium]